MGPIFCVHGEPVDYLRLVEIRTTSPVHDLHLPILRSRNVQFSMFNLCMKKYLLYSRMSTWASSRTRLNWNQSSREVHELFKGVHLCLEKWTTNLSLENLKLDTLRLWIQITALPPEFISQSNLTVITSRAGALKRTRLDKGPSS